MINVELSPATYLGVVLIGSGITLLQIRNQKPLLSRDTDIIAACISILAGGILIFQVCAVAWLLIRLYRVAAKLHSTVFNVHPSIIPHQGWRLDPILLFEQLLIASTAIAFGIEALRLRSELPSSLQQDDGLEGINAMERRGRALPPPPEQSQPWMQQAQQGGLQDPYAQQQPPWPQQVRAMPCCGAGHRAAFACPWKPLPHNQHTPCPQQDVYAPRPPAYAAMQDGAPSTSGQPPAGYDGGYAAADGSYPGDGASYPGEPWQQRAGMGGVEGYAQPPSGDSRGGAPFADYPGAQPPPPQYGSDGQWGAARPAQPGGAQRAQRGRREDPYISVDDWEL